MAIVNIDMKSEEKMADITTIQISKDLQKKLIELGKKSDTYEDIIRSLINNQKKK